MTGLDLAFTKGFSGAAPTEAAPFVAPFQTKWWQDLIYYAGKPEEWMSKTVANALSNNPKYDWDQPSYYGHQQTWSDLLHDTGIDDALSPKGGSFPVVSTTLGLALSVMLDPMMGGYVKTASLTKKGVIGAEVAQGLKSSEKVGYDIFARETLADGKTVSVLPKQHLYDEAERLATQAQDETVKKEIRDAALGSLSRTQKKLGEVDDLNALLKQYQAAGASLQDLSLAPTKWEQARQGQRALLGLRNPFSKGFPGWMKMQLGIEDASPLEKATVLGGSQIDPYVFKAAGALYDGIGGAATRVFQGAIDKLFQGKLPFVKTPQMREAEQHMKNVMSGAEVTGIQVKDLMEHFQNKLGLTREQAHAVFDTIEAPVSKISGEHAGQALKDVLKKAWDDSNPSVSEFGIAQGIAKDGTSPTPGSNLIDGKLAYQYDTGLAAEDMRQAVSQFSNAAPKMSVGQHETQLSDRFITTKARTQAAADFRHEEVTDIFGVAHYTKVQMPDDSLLLVAKKYPGMHKVETAYASGVKWTADHTRNLEITAAALAAKGKSLVGLQPSDILVNPQGLIQIINPDVITDAKNIASARDVSKTVLADFLDRVGDPLGPSREFATLANDKSAKKVLKSQAQYMRVKTASSDLQDGVAMAYDIASQAVNMAPHLDYIRGLAHMTPEDAVSYARANKIAEAQDAIRKERATGSTSISMKPIEVMRDKDTGVTWVRDGRDRLTAAILENVDVVPIKTVDYTGEKLDMGAYHISKPVDLVEAGLGQNDTAIQGLKINYHASTKPNAVGITVGPDDFLRFSTETGEPSREMVSEFRQKLQKGEPVEPVSLQIDLATSKVTSFGSWRAKAAKQAGVQDLPVSVEFTRAGEPTAHLSPDETMELLRVVRDSRGSLNEVISDTYKLISPTGDRVLLNRDSLNIGSGKRILEKLSELAALSPKGSIKERGGNYILNMFEKFGTPEASMLKAAEFFDQLPDGIGNLVDGLKQLTGVTVSDMRSPLIRNQIEQLAADLKGVSKAYLDDLASRGVFTHSTVQDATRLQKFKQTVRMPDGTMLEGGIVESYASGMPVLASGTKTTAEMVETAKKLMASYADVDSIIPFQKIGLVGVDGQKTFEVRDLIQSKHFKDVVPPANTMSIAKEVKEQLRAEGILYNPSKDDMFRRGLNSSTGRLIEIDKVARSRGDFVANRTQVSFFMTPTGQIFLNSTGMNPNQIMQKVFKEGPYYVAEWGFANKEGIFLNNPFGAVIQKAGVSEVKAMAKRVRSLARKFQEMGFSGSTRLDITAPFDGSIWEKMYEKGATIDDVLKDSWKLDLPADIKNMPLDVRIDAAHSTIAIDRPRLTNPKLQEFAEKLEHINDVLFTEEAKAGLPVNYLSGYMPRFVTREGLKAMEALNKAYPEFISTVKSITNQEAFLKPRLFTDNTTSEVNSLITQLRKYKLEGWQPEQIYEKVIDQIKNKGDFKTLNAIADEFNKVSPDLKLSFFNQDPMYAMMRRGLDSSQAVKRIGAVESLTAHGAVWSGTIEDHAALFGARKNIDDLSEDIRKVATSIEETKATITELGKSPDLAKLKGEPEKSIAELEKLQEKKGKLEARRMGLETLAMKNKGILANDVNIRNNRAYVGGDSIQRLLEAGLITDAEVARQAGKELVEIDLTKYKDVLSKDGTKIVLFTEESRPIAMKYFGSMQDQGVAQTLKNHWDTFTNMWKGWTLFAAPQYHIRNIFSNFYMAWLGGVESMEPYQVSMNLATTMHKFRNGSLTWEEANKIFDATTFADNFGGVHTLRDVYQEFIAHGGITGGLHFNEFTNFGGDVAKSNMFIERAVQSGLTPSSELAANVLMDNKLLRRSRSFGASSENFSRFAVFYNEWKNTGSFEQAGLHMKAVLYDYSDMSLFEKSIVRRVLPFYSWSRNNIPRMLETLITEPVKHYRFAKWANSWESGALDGRLADSDEVPEWLSHGIIVAKDSKGNYVIKQPDGFIPVYDVFRFFDSPGQTILEGLTPILKVPIEQLSNKSLYRKGADIEKYSGEPSKSWTLSSLGFSKRATSEGPLGIFNVVLNDALFNNLFRPGKIVSKFIDSIGQKSTMESEPPGLIAAFLDLLIGRAYTSDPNEARAQLYTDWNKHQKIIRGYANKAEADDNDAASQQLRRILLDLELRKPVR